VLLLALGFKNIFALCVCVCVLTQIFFFYKDSETYRTISRNVGRFLQLLDDDTPDGEDEREDGDSDDEDDAGKVIVWFVLFSLRTRMTTLNVFCHVCFFLPCLFVHRTRCLTRSCVPSRAT
jgi:hypothetical protein